MASPPTRTEALALLRSLLRTAREFTDYNIREYAKRRSVDAFRHNRHLSEPAEIATAFADGKSQLAIAKRQAVIQSFYSPTVKNVMEVKHS